MGVRLLFVKLLLLLVLSTNSNCFSQSKGAIRVAEKHFNDGNYRAALIDYLSFLRLDSNNLDYNRKLGICYLNTNIDKPKAIPYLEKVLTKSGDTDANLYYLLGRAYQFDYRFNDAIKMFKMAKKSNGNEALKDIEQQIEHCYNAIEILKFPLDVTFQNMGGVVNSAQSDYHPFVPKNESFLIYNSKRKNEEKILLNGSYHSETYLSLIEKGKYTKPKKIGKYGKVIGLSSNGDYLLFNKGAEDDKILFIAEYKDQEIQNYKELPETINSKTNETSGSISNDGNTIYFASDREGGFGGLDIYVSKRLPNGEWGLAQNLGGGVNTKFDDDFPNIVANDKTLYFSSKGHTSIGGYDIFKVSWDKSSRTWLNARNIGYPLNTVEDDVNFRTSKNGRRGYISALKKDGYGDLDIYNVTFNGVDPKYTIIKGRVNLSDSLNKIQDAFILIVDLKTNEDFGTYMINPVSGKYVVILPPGKYNMIVEASGLMMYQENIEIYGKSSQKDFINKDIQLKFSE